MKITKKIKTLVLGLFLAVNVGLISYISILVNNNKNNGELEKKRNRKN
ncbi:hypothetical protein [Mycoplasmopsis pulmonis]|nr:hypothetical protein [Mycoplasmopsis pulmonis]